MTVNTLPVEETAVSIINEDTGDVKDKIANKTKETSAEETFLFQDIEEQLRYDVKETDVFD